MNKLLRRLAAGALSAVMLAVCFTGCDGKATNASDSTSDVADGTAAAPIRDISSVELVKEMKIGWSLGNTLDAGYEGVRGAAPETIEKSWGNPITTKEMIDTVKAAGFNVLRVPVTWDWSTGEAPDYTINKDWMARVREVVNYGIDNDMFVILNIHHESSWHYPTEDNYEAASDRLKKIWTQIGTEFMNYDEHLIFEGMNEPRIIGSAEEWNGGSEETRAVVNKLNADFVQTVRSLGGNNELRHLMIPGYAASSSEVAMKDIVVPENDDKIIVSVHAYLPYNFALAENGRQVWVSNRNGQRDDIDNLADSIKSLFLDKGQAVIIGEFGARSRDNEEYRANWAKYYITKMKSIGVPCLWWDNGAFTGNGELFGLIDRKTLTWRYPNLLDSMIKAANGEYTFEDIDAEAEELMNNRAQAQSNS